MLNKKKPYGTIQGTMSSTPNARYEQDGKFFNAQGLELDASGEVGEKVPKPKAAKVAEEAPVPDASEGAPDKQEETVALDETAPMPALKEPFGPVVTDGKTKAELKAICQERGISIARKDTLASLAEKIHAQAEAAG